MLRSFSRIALLILLALAGCRPHTEKKHYAPQNNRYARLFELRPFDGFTLLTVKRPFPGGKARTFVLRPRKADAPLPDSLKKYPLLRVPLQRIVATSVTHLEPLEMLGAGDRLVGFTQTRYIVSDYFRQRVQNGQLHDTGNELMPDAEAILALRPDALLVFSTGNDRKDFSLYRKAGIPVVYMAEWLEKTPLGRAEWLRVFGALTGRSQRADSLFGRIAKRYEHTRDSINRLLKTHKRPKVFRGGMFGDKWYMAGGASWAAQLIRDAGGDYVVRDSTHTGSLAVNYENAVAYLLQSQIWLDPGAWTSKRQIQDAVPQAIHAPFWKTGKIFSVNLKTNERGQIIFFERSPMHPDWVLDDLARIFHSDSVSDGSFHFYAPLRD